MGDGEACKKGHFFTAVVDCESVLFAYTEKHTQDFVKKLFCGFRGYLQSDSSNVYDIIDRGPPTDADTGETIKLVGCWAFRKLPPAQRKLMRDEHVRPLIDGFFQWVKGARASIDGHLERRRTFPLRERQQPRTKGRDVTNSRGAPVPSYEVRCAPGERPTLVGFRRLAVFLERWPAAANI
ncbi:MAG: transposase [Polyangiaceae bacterium]